MGYLVAWNKQRDVIVDWKNSKVIKEYIPPSKPASVKGCASSLSVEVRSRGTISSTDVRNTIPNTEGAGENNSLIYSYLPRNTTMHVATLQTNIYYAS